MRVRINHFISERSSLQVMLIALSLVFVIAAMDHATGYELSFSIFYLIPIALATWYAGLLSGALLSVVSAIVWLIADITSGHLYSRPFIPLWNAGVRFLFFIVTAWLLSAVSKRLDAERRMARLDGLTGILNRRAFAASAGTVFNLAERFRRSTAVAFIDLDNFKHVNDTRGHSEGDRVLKSVAATLQASLRKADLVGRLGGDEFAVLLPETTSAGAQRVFETLRQTLLKRVSEQGWPIGFSIGVAFFQEAPASVEEAIKFADALMYRVKKGGKNRLVFDIYAGPSDGNRPGGTEHPQPPRSASPDARFP